MRLLSHRDLPVRLVEEGTIIGGRLIVSTSEYTRKKISRRTHAMFSSILRCFSFFLSFISMTVVRATTLINSIINNYYRLITINVDVVDELFQREVSLRFYTADVLATRRAILSIFYSYNAVAVATVTNYKSAKNG